MKKLMIAAAIVCAAVASQAANFNWGFANYDIQGPSESYEEYGYLSAGYAYLYLGSTCIAGPVERDGDWLYGSFDLTATDSSGKVQALSDGNISSSFDGQAYKLVLMTTDKNWKVEIDGVSTYTSVSGAIGEPDKNYEVFQYDGAIYADDWTEVVPEPTSGLLLLIGMAGLALKRKRA